MELREHIQKVLNEYTQELHCPKIKLTEDLINEVTDFNTSEELLRAGGISTETLDRAAFGFADEDIKTLMPEQLHIKWKEDYNNVKWEADKWVKKYGMPLRDWAEEIDLTEPIEVAYGKDKKSIKKFYIEDGHHRYYAAKILNKKLNVKLEIRINPIEELAPGIGYDDFHRCLFNQVMQEKKTLKVYHGTKSKFVKSIKENGLKDKTGYNQGWYMVSTDFASALFHTHPDDKKDFVYVFEFEIPIPENDRWVGYPYLWEGGKINDNSTWFALMQALPKSFIKKIHKVSYEDWLSQKQKEF